MRSLSDPPDLIEVCASEAENAPGRGGEAVDAAVVEDDEVVVPSAGFSPTVDEEGEVSTLFFQLQLAGLALGGGGACELADDDDDADCCWNMAILSLSDPPALMDACASEVDIVPTLTAPVDEEEGAGLEVGGGEMVVVSSATGVTLSSPFALRPPFSSFSASLVATSTGLSSIEATGRDETTATGDSASGTELTGIDWVEGDLSGMAIGSTGSASAAADASSVVGAGVEVGSSTGTTNSCEGEGEENVGYVSLLRFFWADVPSQARIKARPPFPPQSKQRTFGNSPLLPSASSASYDP